MGVVKALLSHLQLKKRHYEHVLLVEHKKFLYLVLLHFLFFCYFQYCADKVLNKEKAYFIIVRYLCKFLLECSRAVDIIKKINYVDTRYCSVREFFC